MYDLRSREGMERYGRVASGTQDGTRVGKRHARCTRSSAELKASGIRGRNPLHDGRRPAPSRRRCLTGPGSRAVVPVWVESQR